MQVTLEHNQARLTGRPDTTASPGPLYRPEVEQQLLKAARSNPLHEGVQVWGPPDANGPGGWGIYPYIGYWIDCPIGRWLGLRMLAGWWNRFEGLDQYKALDDAHLGRAGHVVSWLAAEGEPFAKRFQRRIMRRLYMRWHSSSSSTNMLLWGVDDLLERYPAGQGCSQLGRPFAHALIFAVEFAVQTGSKVLAYDLLRVARHCQDPSGAVYLIRPEVPPFPGVVDNAYKKKIQAKGLDLAAIERAGSPALQVSFEEQLTLYAVDLYLQNFAIEDWMGELHEGLRRMGPHPPEVRFPDAPELDHQKPTAWGHALAPFLVRGELDPLHEITHYPIGGGAGGAIHPSLYPSTR